MAVDAGEVRTDCRRRPHAVRRRRVGTALHRRFRRHLIADAAMWSGMFAQAPGKANERSEERTGSGTRATVGSTRWLSVGFERQTEPGGTRLQLITQRS